MTFNVGDTIQPTSLLKWGFNRVFPDLTYTVKDVINDGQCVKLQDSDVYWMSNKFVLIRRAAVQVGDSVKVTYKDDGTSVSGRVSQLEPSNNSFVIGSGHGFHRVYGPESNGYTLEIFKRTYAVGDLLTDDEYWSSDIQPGTVTDEGFVRCGVVWVNMNNGRVDPRSVRSSKTRKIVLMVPIAPYPAPSMAGV